MLLRTPEITGVLLLHFDVAKCGSAGWVVCSLHVLIPPPSRKAEYVPGVPGGFDKMHQQGKYGTARYNSDSESDSESDSGSMPSDAGGPVPNLSNHLSSKAEKSTFDNRQFWPRGSLGDVITVQHVHGKLRSGEVDQKELDRLVHFITKRCKKVFAISLCIGLNSKNARKAMTQFQESDVDDGMLPLNDQAQAFFRKGTKIYRHPWSEFRVEQFCHKQWEFLAPSFNRNHNELSLQVNHILPFTWASQHVGQGAFGEVHEVTIHPAHEELGIHVSLFNSYST
jgi:hypothetical protein